MILLYSKLAKNDESWHSLAVIWIMHKTSCCNMEFRQKQL